MKCYGRTLCLRDNPALIEQYKEYHQRVWPEVLAGIREVGILEMRIFAMAMLIQRQTGGNTVAMVTAVEKALEELKPQFAQCPHCAKWVCRQSCWNDKRGLCKECAPDMGVEMSAAQASRSREEVWAHAKMSAEDKKLSESNWRETIVASCPRCQVPLATNAKFCPNCGSSMANTKKCANCGATVPMSSKFCLECGKPT